MESKTDRNSLHMFVILILALIVAGQSYALYQSTRPAPIIPDIPAPTSTFRDYFGPDSPFHKKWLSPMEGGKYGNYLEEMRSHMNSLFSEMFTPGSRGEGNDDAPPVSSMTMTEEKDRFVVTLDVPDAENGSV